VAAAKEKVLLSVESVQSAVMITGAGTEGRLFVTREEASDCNLRLPANRKSKTAGGPYAENVSAISNRGVETPLLGGRPIRFASERSSGSIILRSYSAGRPQPGMGRGCVTRLLRRKSSDRFHCSAPSC
jgi:hypothetical protein